MDFGRAAMGGCQALLRPLFPLCMAGLSATSAIHASGVPAVIGASVDRPALVGTVERIVVHGVALVGNLEGDPVDRHVSVYLPPSYASSPLRRYPVVFLLHGFQQRDTDWYGPTAGAVDVPRLMEASIAAGGREMILVTPDAMTVFGGSNYSSGATTGDWESFVARDLVNAIDARYRTIAAAASRGIAGHSMGGYGALRIGMRHPETFSSIYAMSPCCVSADSNIPKTPEAIAAFQAVTRPPADFRDIRSAVAAAAAWAPNPSKPPLFYDAPVANGGRREDVIARMTTNRPLEMVDQYVATLRRQSLAFDVGDQDPSIAANMARLHRTLSGYGLKHDYEVYPGTHVSGVAMRMRERMLPFMGAHLTAEAQR